MNVNNNIRHIIMLIFGIIICVVVVISENKRTSNRITVNFDYKVDSININGTSNYKDRGGILFNEKFVINTSAKWIEDDCGYKNWESNGPIIDFDSLPHEYTLDDLGVPYIIFKESNNDTLHVIKDDCSFKFLLITDTE
jgi:hypothetical protein